MLHGGMIASADRRVKGDFWPPFVPPKITSSATPRCAIGERERRFASPLRVTMPPFDVDHASTGHLSR